FAKYRANDAMSSSHEPLDAGNSAHGPFFSISPGPKPQPHDPCSPSLTRRTELKQPSGELVEQALIGDQVCVDGAERGESGRVRSPTRCSSAPGTAGSCGMTSSRA